MKVIIIGGGAAGMMAAATIAESGRGDEVLLIEKNAKLGVKVAISGGGRCNVTSGIEDVRTLSTKYPRGGKFLTSALYAFGPRQIREWFEERGVPLKKEVDGRVFPYSDVGQDIVDVFERLFKQTGTAVHYKETVRDIEKTTTGYTVTTNLSIYTADAVVLALGGQAYRHTGSAGDGYGLAEKLGHHTTRLAPSLNSFILQETWPKELSGVSFADVNFSTPSDARVRARGAFVWTHRGMSGPAVFALSSQVAFVNYTKQNPLEIRIDFCPERTQEEIVRYLRTYTEQRPKQLFKHAVHQFLPQSCVEHIGAAEHLPITTPCAEVSKQQMLATARSLKSLAVHAIGRAAGEEFVTAGGIELSEVHPKTGESALSPRLYFAGEILDVDGYTGGFNLTASWAMGRAVGMALTHDRLDV